MLGIISSPQLSQSLETLRIRSCTPAGFSFTTRR
jgi:hypothetical protein